MKTKLLLSTLLSFIFYLLSSQVPQGFNYQAIARDGSDHLLTDQDLPVMITIQSDSLEGTIFWKELHSKIRTNSHGLFALLIGQGERDRSSKLNAFSEIDWTEIPKFIKTEIYYKDKWLNMGSSRFWTVPYAMAAGELGGSFDKLLVEGKASSLEEALFEVKNNLDQTIFAVYNEGVRIYVSDGDSKGAKGGFAIGGFGMGKGGDEYLRVTRDSTRVYINDLPDKIKKGGFAIGGFGSLKDPNYNFLKVDENKLKGGKIDYLNITDLNTFIGELAGTNTSESGIYNTFIGYNSGLSNIDGYNNVFLGSGAGKNCEFGYNNIFIGNLSGQNASSVTNSTFIGDEAGSNVTGDDNIIIGDNAGTNQYITTNSLLNVTILGIDAGRNVIGENNTFIGYGSGSSWGSSAEKINNTYLGAGAGGGGTSLGNNNVCIGYLAGYGKSGNSKLYIDNDENASPLIGGDFSARQVGINRMPTTYTLEVGGTIWANGSTISAGSTTWSDVRYKTNIEPLKNALLNILKMKGVKYDWRTEEFPDLNFSKGKQIGVIAQDLEDVMPELVTTGPDGYKSVSYEKITPVLIEAVKEQQAIISNQEAEIKLLKDRMEKVEALLKLANYK